MALKKLFILTILILFVFLSGLLARYQAVPYWLEHQKEFFVEGRPIFTSYDSYYFARLADDYKLGVFEGGGTDKLRFVPDYADYPSILPLPSWLFAQLSSLLHTHIENISFWLIPILGALATIPLVVFFWKLNIPFTGFTGALLGVTAFMFVVRTSLNRLDTDSLNLFFMLSIPLSFFLFLEAKEKRVQYLWLVITALQILLFYWWYLHPGLIFALSVTFILAFLWKEYSQKGISFYRDREFLKNLLLILLALNPFFIGYGIYTLAKRVLFYVFGINQTVESGFPNVAISVSELTKFSFHKLAFVTAGNEIAFTVGLVGLVLLIFKYPRVMLLLAAPLAVGLIALTGKNRFAMYLAPFIGLGLGFFLDVFYKKLKETLQGEKLKESLYWGLVGLSLLGIYLLNRASFEYIPRPIMTADVAEAFIELGRQTPPNAWIWSWWDYGYAIQYYARRATFHDGGSQFYPKTYFVALGLTDKDLKSSFNVAKSVAILGEKGIEDLLKEGYTAKQIKELFVSGALVKDKKLTHPVYWLFTPDLIGKFFWISYFGTWNFDLKKGTHLIIEPTQCVEIQRGIYSCGKYIFDAQRMLLITRSRKAFPVAIFAYRTPQKLYISQNPTVRYGIAVENVYTQNPQYYLWFITDTAGFETAFNKLYMLRKTNPYFELTTDQFPPLVVWKMKEN
jgi:dolichyl-diphosphooligosaccharide--protein glycosyltransferase